MNRRDTVIGLLALGIVPFTLKAQPRVARIGILASYPPSNPGAAPAWKAFYGELKARGWVEGHNLVVEGRYSEGRAEKDPVFAGELAEARVELIVAGNSRAVDAVRMATRTIPIVMTNVSHAVEAGYVASLARPGGNITGVTNQLSDLMAKHVELIRSIRQDMNKLGVLWSPNNTGSALAFKDMQAVARGLGIALVSLPVDTPTDIGPALDAARRERVQALHVHPTGAISRGFRQISAWASEHTVMTVSGYNGFTRDGFLLSYGADFADIWRIAASYVDRILRGAKAADLPVQQPTKFEMVVNLKIAAALGLKIPQSVLIRADQVIE